MKYNNVRNTKKKKRRWPSVFLKKINVSPGPKRRAQYNGGMTSNNIREVSFDCKVHSTPLSRVTSKIKTSLTRRKIQTIEKQASCF